MKTPRPIPIRHENQLGPQSRLAAKRYLVQLSAQKERERQRQGEQATATDQRAA